MTGFNHSEHTDLETLLEMSKKDSTIEKTDRLLTREEFLNMKDNIKNQATKTHNGSHKKTSVHSMGGSMSMRGLSKRK